MSTNILVFVQFTKIATYGKKIKQQESLYFIVICHCMALETPRDGQIHTNVAVYAQTTLSMKALNIPILYLFSLIYKYTFVVCLLII